MLKIRRPKIYYFQNALAAQHFIDNRIFVTRCDFWTLRQSYSNAYVVFNSVAK